MKANIIARSLLVLSLMGGVLVACDKEEDKIIVSPSALSTPTSSASSVAVAKTSLDANSELLTLSWAKAQFGSDLVAPVYEILVSPVGSTAEPVVFSPATGSLSYAFTAKQLNELVLETFQLTSGVAADFNFVVRSFPLGTVDKTNSSVVTSSPVVVSLTGLQVEEPIIVPKEYTGVNYYFVGTVFPPAHWDVTSFDYPLFRDEPNSTTYTYTGKFVAGEFKVKTQDKNTWDNTNGLAYGLSGGAVSTDGGAGNFSTTAGFKTVTFSTTGFAVSDYEGDTNTTYTQIGLVGTSLGSWDVDVVVLKPTSYDPHIWVAKRVTINEGELKFRANGSWIPGLSWGGAGALFPAAKAQQVNDNIKVSAAQAGTYNVYFNDLTKHFLFEVYRK